MGRRLTARGSCRPGRSGTRSAGEARGQAGPDAAALGRLVACALKAAKLSSASSEPAKLRRSRATRLLVRGAGPDRAHGVGRDEERKPAAADHRRAFAARGFKAEHDFQGVQTKFGAPAAQIGCRDFLGRIRHRVEPRRHEDDCAGAKARLFQPHADDAHGDFLRQRSPLRRGQTAGLSRLFSTGRGARRARGARLCASRFAGPSPGRGGRRGAPSAGRRRRRDRRPGRRPQCRQVKEGSRALSKRIAPSRLEPRTWSSTPPSRALQTTSRCN